MNRLGKQSLSVCLIIKNEENMLRECLESISDLADQLVVVDTGSTDASIEIAESFKAEIHHFEWCSDFSAARNASIRHATGDWILWIDADERLSADSRGNLEKLLKFESKPVIYKVRIRNLKEDGVNFYLSDAHRLFTNFRKIQFSGKIHEQVSPSAKKVGAEERACDVVLDHLGYSFTGDEKLNKQTRNRAILEAEIIANPNSAYTHLTMAHNYKESGKLADAEKHYRIAMDLKQFDSTMEASLLNSYADTLVDLGRIAEVGALVNRSLKLHKFQNAAYFIRYRVALAKQQNEKAIDALETILSNHSMIKSKGSEISTDIEISSTMVCKTLGDLYFKLEKWEQAAQSYESGLQASPDSIELLRALFKAHEKRSDWPKALDVLGKLIQFEGELPGYVNALGAILVRMEEFEAALQVYLRLAEAQAHDVGLKRKIASLYAKLGQIDKAEEWLS